MTVVGLPVQNKIDCSTLVAGMVSAILNVGGDLRCTQEDLT
jgi:hypothetical protein